MKSIKKMLLGIAFMLISVIGTILYVNNSTIGAIMFFGGLIAGIVFCIDGFLSTD